MPGAEPELSAAVLDASVAVRWVVPERGSDEAAALLGRPIAWVSPRLMLAEVAGALRRKVAAGELRVELAVQAVEVLLDAVDSGLVRLAEDEVAIVSALMLALTLEHKVPDCLYLALAEREGAGLVTADRRLGDLAQRRGIATILIPSA